MKDDFEFENSYGPIDCDITDVEKFIEENRKKKEIENDKKCSKIHSYVIWGLFSFSMIICYSYMMVINNNHEFNDYFNKISRLPSILPVSSSQFRTCFEPYFAIIQYGAFCLIRKIPSRVVSVMFSAFVGFMVLYPAKLIIIDHLQRLHYTPSLYFIFVLYFISVILYFLFGLYTILDENMYNYMIKNPLVLWIIPLELKNADLSGKKLVPNKFSFYVIIFFAVVIFVYHMQKPL